MPAVRWLPAFVRALAVSAVLLLTSACARGTRIDEGTSTSTAVRQAEAAGSSSRVAASADTLLEGSFRWIDVDGRPAPADFPPGSGAMLMDGTLDLRDATLARAGTGGRFGLRFTLRPTPADSARSTGEDGRFVIIADSLHFTPDGRENRPPVRFRYAWRPDGRLALTDTQGHVWLYARR